MTRPDFDDLSRAFHADGWLRFPADPAVLDWAEHARRAGEAALTDPAYSALHVCEGTWFVGLEALPNDALGRVAGSAPLNGWVMAFIERLYGPLPLHRAQLSTVWPGYPRPRDGESEAAARYREKRDAAHVDGLRRDGPARRRFLSEPHAYILGLPLTDAAPEAAPLVVWEGSHHLIARALRAALAPHPPADWPNIDLTDPYQTARRTAFDTCKRVTVPARPGEATLLHRLAVHGVAPWQADDADPRMIAYFRPHLPGGMTDWLSLE
ncbi:hypothetical protein [Chachezhania antarctica]|uniref:hypothetical protein n=1 Tax=Chachezhania antarctica TaxID=2340860 RepID=UPI000EAC77EA|nr:hypothetical protein [Chachezhania antarctica]